MRRAAVVVACALAGCQARTELMVGLATDMPAPGTLDRISLRVDRADNDIPLLEETWTLEPDESLPGSYAIVSEDSQSLALVLTGSKEGDVLVTRTAILALVEGETLFYRMGLTLACTESSNTCPPGSECIEGNCATSQVIPTAKLPTFREEMVTTLTCVSNATYIQTHSMPPIPMEVSPEAGLCPASLCSEGTCLNAP